MKDEKGKFELSILITVLGSMKNETSRIIESYYHHLILLPTGQKHEETKKF